MGHSPAPPRAASCPPPPTHVHIGISLLPFTACSSARGPHARAAGEPGGGNTYTLLPPVTLLPTFKGCTLRFVPGDEVRRPAHPYDPAATTTKTRTRAHMAHMRLAAGAASCSAAMTSSSGSKGFTNPCPARTRLGWGLSAEYDGPRRANTLVFGSGGACWPRSSLHPALVPSMPALVFSVNCASLSRTIKHTPA
ncbi:hypothetical protein C8R44DRAFT_744053 [Mycena epipterygia]|nr:hypothetical protein C8R44DRAFT_744053 [Mycena epipterygia]